MLATYFCNELENWQKIGDGSFGRLYKGKLPSGKQIAIKIMKGNTDGTSWTEIGRLRNLDHPSILKLLAIVPLSGHEYDKNDEDNYCDCSDSIKFRTWLILEYMSFGSLKTFVSTRQGGLSAATMDKMAYQIAVGMNYLHRSANIVHRDLAARNILVGEHFEVKIADFGLCVEYFENQYYFGTHGKPCPVRWMPPENLPDAPLYNASGRYSRKGDVWSYGVVLYEIWTRGKMPLGNLDDEDVMYQVKNYGISVLTPDYGFPVHARSWVMEVMKMCFQYNKNKRPNFRQITNYIQNNSDYRLR